MSEIDPIKIDSFETIEPIGKRVLIRKDEDKKHQRRHPAA